MKRKDVDDVNDDFFDFALSSPAQKIRRLDAELAPTIDEQDAFVEQSPESSHIPMDELSSVPANEERAIVLYNPNKKTPSLQSPPPFSIFVDSDFISGFRNPVIWSTGANTTKSALNETQKQDDNLQHPPTIQVHEMMDADDAMDIEDNFNTNQIPKEGLNQWQQQHCMIQQPPNILSTPITWFGRGG